MSLPDLPAAVPPSAPTSPPSADLHTRPPSRDPPAAAPHAAPAPRAAPAVPLPLPTADAVRAMSAAAGAGTVYARLMAAAAALQEKIARCPPDDYAALSAHLSSLAALLTGDGAAACLASAPLPAGGMGVARAAWRGLGCHDALGVQRKAAEVLRACAAAVRAGEAAAAANKEKPQRQRLQESRPRYSLLWANYAALALGVLELLPACGVQLQQQLLEAVEVDVVGALPPPLLPLCLRGLLAALLPTIADTDNRRVLALLTRGVCERLRSANTDDGDAAAVESGAHVGGEAALFGVLWSLLREAPELRHPALLVLKELLAGRPPGQERRCLGHAPRTAIAALAAALACGQERTLRLALDVLLLYFPLHLAGASLGAAAAASSSSPSSSSSSTRRPRSVVALSAVCSRGEVALLVAAAVGALGMPPPPPYALGASETAGPAVVRRVWAWLSGPSAAAAVTYARRCSGPLLTAALVSLLRRCAGGPGGAPLLRLLATEKGDGGGDDEEGLVHVWDAFCLSLQHTAAESLRAAEAVEAQRRQLYPSAAAASLSANGPGGDRRSQSVPPGLVLPLVLLRSLEALLRCEVPPAAREALATAAAAAAAATATSSEGLPGEQHDEEADDSADAGVEESDPANLTDDFSFTAADDGLAGPSAAVAAAAASAAAGLLVTALGPAFTHLTCAALAATWCCSEACALTPPSFNSSSSLAVGAAPPAAEEEQETCSSSPVTRYCAPVADTVRRVLALLPPGCLPALRQRAADALAAAVAALPESASPATSEDAAAGQPGKANGQQVYAELSASVDCIAQLTCLMEEVGAEVVLSDSGVTTPTAAAAAAAAVQEAGATSTTAALKHTCSAAASLCNALAEAAGRLCSGWRTVSVEFPEAAADSPTTRPGPSVAFLRTDLVLRLLALLEANLVLYSLFAEYRSSLPSAAHSAAAGPPLRIAKPIAEGLLALILSTDDAAGGEESYKAAAGPLISALFAMLLFVCDKVMQAARSSERSDGSSDINTNDEERIPVPELFCRWLQSFLEAAERPTLPLGVVCVVAHHLVDMAASAAAAAADTVTPASERHSGPTRVLASAAAREALLDDAVLLLPRVVGAVWARLRAAVVGSTRGAEAELPAATHVLVRAYALPAARRSVDGVMRGADDDNCRCVAAALATAWHARWSMERRAADPYGQPYTQQRRRASTQAASREGTGGGGGGSSSGWSARAAAAGYASHALFLTGYDTLLRVLAEPDAAAPAPTTTTTTAASVSEAAAAPPTQSARRRAVAGLFIRFFERPQDLLLPLLESYLPGVVPYGDGAEVPARLTHAQTAAAGGTTVVATAALCYAPFQSPDVVRALLCLLRLPGADTLVERCMVSDVGPALQRSAENFAKHAVGGDGEELLGDGGRRERHSREPLDSLFAVLVSVLLSLTHQSLVSMTVHAASSSPAAPSGGLSCTTVTDALGCLDTLLELSRAAAFPPVAVVHAWREVARRSVPLLRLSVRLRLGAVQAALLHRVRSAVVYLDTLPTQSLTALVMEDADSGAGAGAAAAASSSAPHTTTSATPTGGGGAGARRVLVSTTRPPTLHLHALEERVRAADGEERRAAAAAPKTLMETLAQAPEPVLTHPALLLALEEALRQPPDGPTDVLCVWGDFILGVLPFLYSSVVPVTARALHLFLSAAERDAHTRRRRRRRRLRADGGVSGAAHPAGDDGSQRAAVLVRTVVRLLRYLTALAAAAEREEGVASTLGGNHGTHGGTSSGWFGGSSGDPASEAPSAERRWRYSPLLARARRTLPRLTCLALAGLEEGAAGGASLLVSALDAETPRTSERAVGAAAADLARLLWREAGACFLRCYLTEWWARRGRLSLTSLLPSLGPFVPVATTPASASAPASSNDSITAPASPSGAGAGEAEREALEPPLEDAAALALEDCVRLRRGCGATLEELLRAAGSVALEELASGGSGGGDHSGGLPVSGVAVLFVSALLSAGDGTRHGLPLPSDLAAALEVLADVQRRLGHLAGSGGAAVGDGRMAPAAYGAVWAGVLRALQCMAALAQEEGSFDENRRLLRARGTALLAPVVGSARYAAVVATSIEMITVPGPLPARLSGASSPSSAPAGGEVAAAVLAELSGLLPGPVPEDLGQLLGSYRVQDALLALANKTLFPTLQLCVASVSEAERVARAPLAAAVVRLLRFSASLYLRNNTSGGGGGGGRRVRPLARALLTPVLEAMQQEHFFRLPTSVLAAWRGVVGACLAQADGAAAAAAWAAYAPAQGLSTMLTSWDRAAAARADQLRRFALFVLSVPSALAGERTFAHFALSQVRQTIEQYGGGGALPTEQELAAHPSALRPARAALLLCRTLIARLPPPLLSPLWACVVPELARVCRLSAAAGSASGGKGGAWARLGADARREAAALLLEAVKVLDAAVVAAPERSALFRWFFVSESGLPALAGGTLLTEWRPEPLGARWTPVFLPLLDAHLLGCPPAPPPGSGAEASARSATACPDTLPAVLAALPFAGRRPVLCLPECHYLRYPSLAPVIRAFLSRIRLDGDGNIRGTNTGSDGCEAPRATGAATAGDLYAGDGWDREYVCRLVLMDLSTVDPDTGL